MQIANRIAECLATKRINQVTLARKVDIQPEHLNRIIKGSVIPKVYLGIRIAKVLNTRPEYLWYKIDG